MDTPIEAMDERPRHKQKNKVRTVYCPACGSDDVHIANAVKTQWADTGEKSEELKYACSCGARFN